MSRLTRDGTAEPVSRDQILRHARGQGNIHFPCSADHEQDYWQPYPFDPYSAICDDHTYIKNCVEISLHDENGIIYLDFYKTKLHVSSFVTCVCVFVVLSVNRSGLNHLQQYMRLPTRQVVTKRYKGQWVTSWRQPAT